MCGINGMISLNGQKIQKETLLKMNAAIKHRGPDADGIFTDRHIGLGHVRLSIIDLSPAGNQPMSDPTSGITVVFNGEIYNYQLLKQRLPYAFKTQTDTEVIIAAYLEWGDAFWNELEGMFTIAIYDSRQQKVLIGRDRLGIKPLYIWQNHEYVAFSSEIKGLLASGLFAPTLQKELLPAYFTLGSIPGKDTLLKGVVMADPGTYMIIHDGQLHTRTFWQIPPSTNGFHYEEVKKQVKTLFMNAVQKRLVSDVPIGVFLSGGIDSTAITSAMCQLGQPSDVHTFTISFDNQAFNEAEYARFVANKWGTTHTEIHLKPSVFLDDMEKILSAYDHPGSDGANTFVVSQAAKKAGITVALSGLGGDEVFCGYPVFHKLLPYHTRLSPIPYPIRTLFQGIPEGLLSAKNRKLMSLLLEKELELTHVYRVFRSISVKNDVQHLIGQDYHYPGLDPLFDEATQLLHAISKAEMHFYMQPVLLRDADQMSMYHALEVRVPFLDHHLIEYVMSLPDDCRIKNQRQKSLLVDALGPDMLPPEIVNRKKMGFVLPWNQWMKSELSPYVIEAIEGFKKTDAEFGQKWQKAYEHFYKGGKKYHWNMFWCLLTLKQWMDKNRISFD
jgi:asparagine synthase (glutamine-hydrolysing)